MGHAMYAVLSDIDFWAPARQCVHARGCLLYLSVHRPVARARRTPCSGVSSPPCRTGGGWWLGVGRRGRLRVATCLLSRADAVTSDQQLVDLNSHSPSP